MDGYEYMDATKSELLQILYSLQSHWNVIEDELIEINKDIAHLRECLRKYGEHFRIPLEYLKDLKKEKKEIMKKIIVNMDNFEGHIQGSRTLVHRLNKQHVELNEGNVSSAKSMNIYQRSPDVVQTGNDTVFVTTSYQTPIHHYKLITKTPLHIDTRNKYTRSINSVRREVTESTAPIHPM